MSLWNLSRAKLASDEWDPQPAEVANLDAIAVVGRPFYYIVGDVVLCECVLAIESTTTGAYRFELRVPVERPVFASTGDAVGCANPALSGGFGGAVVARPGSLLVDGDSNNGSTAEFQVPVHFAYRVRE